MFKFYWPWIFLLLPLPWCVLYLPPTKSCEQGLKTTYFDHLMGVKLRVKHTASKGFPLLLSCAWLSMLCATARPQFVGAPLPLKYHTRDIMLAVDLSGSMVQTDMDPQRQTLSRLDVVKYILKKFIQKRKGDRLGLILFGTHAYLQAPLTGDYNTVNTLLSEAEVGMAGPQTAIGDAIGLAVKKLTTGFSKRPLLILLTDGANNAGQLQPLEATKVAKAFKIRIYTIGIGAIQGTLGRPNFFPVFPYNPSAELDEKLLKTIATTTGGQYFRAQDRTMLENVYAKVNNLEPVSHASQFFIPSIELYYYPLALGLIFIFMILIKQTAWSELV